MARTYVLGPNAARELKRLIRGTGGTSRRVVGSGAIAFDSEYVPPFTVQWAQSVNDGDGSWVIWLPGDELVTWSNTPIDVADDLEAVGGDYPSGWYLIDSNVLDPDSGGTLHLNVTGAASENDTPSASFASSADADADMSIKVCQAIVDVQTGERKVKQFVAYAIVLANDGVKPKKMSVQITRTKADSSGGGAAGITLLTVDVGLEMNDGSVVAGTDTTNLTQALHDAAGDFEISTAEGSGLVLSSEGLDGEEDEEGSTGNVLDLQDRDPEDEFAVRTVTYTDADGKQMTVKVLATDPVEVPPEEPGTNPIDYKDHDEPPINAEPDKDPEADMADGNDISGDAGGIVPETTGGYCNGIGGASWGPAITGGNSISSTPCAA